MAYNIPFHSHNCNFIAPLSVPNGCAISTDSHPRWNMNNYNSGSNNFNFNGLPGGIRMGNFSGLGVRGCFLTRSLNPDGSIVSFNLWNSNPYFFIIDLDSRWGGSVRAVRPYFNNIPDGTVLANQYVDGNGNSYNAVKIGFQLWTTRNLFSTSLQNGTPIINITNDNDWLNANSPAYCWYNNDSPSFRLPYGALYNMNAISNNLVLSEDWRVPLFVDVFNLFNYMYRTYNVITIHTIGTFFKSCRQVNHPLA